MSFCEFDEFVQLNITPCVDRTQLIHISLQSVACLLILLLVPSKKKKLFILIKVTMSTFSFYNILLCFTSVSIIHFWVLWHMWGHTYVELFLKRNHPFSLCVYFFVKDELTIFVWVYFWALHFPHWFICLPFAITILFWLIQL
jgi:hypothetical protein